METNQYYYHTHTKKKIEYSDNTQAQHFQPLHNIYRKLPDLLMDTNMAEPQPEWIKAYSLDVLEKIKLARVLPLRISEIVAEYGFNSCVTIRVCRNLDKWPWYHRSRSVPLSRFFPDINLDLSNTLANVMVKFQIMHEMSSPARRHDLRLVLVKGIPCPTWVVVKNVNFSRWNEVELSLPNLNRTLGEALHGMGLTWGQLQASMCVVRAKLDHIRLQP